mmetsp:Transcript_29282/g.44954  ORF Transcript_29282/g.44954 Transcript_29282/m.44954 type:complete len:316 (+) Transcript_29282:207-1154(+)|eukprot:CAMPEP_0195288396 /NCGR_PEP_ID=MMETSP0707-20130614/5082_1 /TAXON_ID=33640 /ORGANISM="Asterionellopsis glacialis, Strain CCMP134" /LENGTH=315 /DNA_ID=CAMNT_0040348263 /DNA_START=143 /DNA_END=1090 /DNA_ORIENTATION=+
MAPNVVKDTPIDALSTLDVSSIVNTKYLPLTHPQEEQQRIEEQEQEQQQQDNYVEGAHLKDESHPANSYWDWDEETSEQNKEAVIERIVAEDKIRDVLSVDHMIQNTIRSNLKADIEEQNEDVKESAESYWEMPAPSDENTTSSTFVQAQHARDVSHPKNSYWDWPVMTEEDQKNAFLEQIVKEEEIRQLLSAQHMEDTMVADTNNEDAEMIESNVNSDSYWNDTQQDECVQAPLHTYDDSHPHATYWEWETLTEQEKKQKLITQIIKGEKIRQMLSAAHLKENLLQDCAHIDHITDTQVQTAATVGGEQSYWEW